MVSEVCKWNGREVIHSTEQNPAQNKFILKQKVRESGIVAGRKRVGGRKRGEYFLLSVVNVIYQIDIVLIPELDIV